MASKGFKALKNKKRSVKIGWRIRMLQHSSVINRRRSHKRKNIIPIK